MSDTQSNASPAPKVAPHPNLPNALAVIDALAREDEAPCAAMLRVVAMLNHGLGVAEIRGDLTTWFHETTHSHGVKLGGRWLSGDELRALVVTPEYVA